MAIVKCQECGREISEKSRLCPHCGCPTANSIHNAAGTKKHRLSILLIVIAIIMVVFLVCLQFFKVQYSPEEQDHLIFFMNVCNGIAFASLIISVMLLFIVVATKIKKGVCKSVVTLVVLFAVFLAMAYSYMCQGEHYRMQKMVTDAFYKDVIPDIRNATEDAINGIVKFVD